MGKRFGFTLLEIMLSLSIAMLASIGVYMMLQRAQVSAEVKREQERIENLAESIKANFVMERSFESLTHEFLIANIQGLTNDGDSFTSAIGKPMEVRPSTTNSPFDSFDIRYDLLDTRLCLRMVRALQSFSSDIYIESLSVQHPDGRLLSDDAVINACSAEPFKLHQGSVAFRFATPRNTTFGTLSSCSCSDASEETTGSCASGEIGSVRYERSATCTGGIPSCPTQEWTLWAMVESTCAPDGSPTTPHFITPPDSCVASRTLRSSSCPDSTHIGVQVFEQVANCPGPTLGPWTLVGDTCAPIPPHASACTPSVNYQPGTCPTGMLGATIEASSSTCASPSASPVWGPWLVVESSCSALSACHGPPSTCCNPAVEQRAGSPTSCPAGFFGPGGTTIEQRIATCASATATPSWGGWLFHSGTGSSCSACPAPLTSTETRWQARSGACPSGHTGTITWEAQELREQTMTYDCSASPLTLPAPLHGPWTTWTETGLTQNLVNTCAPTTPGGRICTFTAYNSTWTIGGETCNGVTASFGLNAINEGETMGVADNSWGFGVYPQKGTARLYCDPVRVQTFLDSAVDTFNHCTTAPDRDACMMLHYGEPNLVLSVLGDTCLPDPVTPQGCWKSGNATYGTGPSSSPPYQWWEIRTSNGYLVDECSDPNGNNCPPPFISACDIGDSLFHEKSIGNGLGEGYEDASCVPLIQGCSTSALPF